MLFSKLSFEVSIRTRFVSADLSFARLQIITEAGPTINQQQPNTSPVQPSTVFV